MWIALVGLAWAAPAPPPVDTRQLVVVQTADWGAPQGVLTRFARAGADTPWEAQSSPIPVVVGRAGMGWGLGLHDASGLEGPIKHEGDRRAPAGLFHLGAAMGTDPAPPGAGWPYLASAPGMVCVDDGRSALYNQVVGPGVPVTWSSAEQLVRTDALYHRLVVVQQNPAAVPGAGSCVFLHIWRAADKGTAGCTAMEASSMAELIGWLDPSASPLLLQLPAGELAGWATAWGLPRPP